MRVLNAHDGVMTNFEVAQLLQDQQRLRDEQEAALPLPGARRGTAGSAAWSSQQTVSALSDQVLAYLEKTGNTAQEEASIVTFTQEVARFGLTRTECLGLANTPPSSTVEVHLLVEECEERLSADDVRELLELCQRTLVVPSAGGEAGGEESLPAAGDALMEEGS